MKTSRINPKLKDNKEKINFEEIFELLGGFLILLIGIIVIGSLGTSFY